MTSPVYSPSTCGHCVRSKRACGRTGPAHSLAAQTGLVVPPPVAVPVVPEPFVASFGEGDPCDQGFDGYDSKAAAEAALRVMREHLDAVHDGDGECPDEECSVEEDASELEDEIGRHGGYGGCHCSEFEYDGYVDVVGFALEEELPDESVVAFWLDESGTVVDLRTMKPQDVLGLVEMDSRGCYDGSFTVHPDGRVEIEWTGVSGTLFPVGASFPAPLRDALEFESVTGEGVVRWLEAEPATAELAYARWEASFDVPDGHDRPDIADALDSVGHGLTDGGWKAYSALTSGRTGELPDRWASSGRKDMGWVRLNVPDDEETLGNLAELCEASEWPSAYATSPDVAVRAAHPAVFPVVEARWYGLASEGHSNLDNVVAGAHLDDEAWGTFVSASEAGIVHLVGETTKHRPLTASERSAFPVISERFPLAEYPLAHSLAADPARLERASARLAALEGAFQGEAVERRSWSRMEESASVLASELLDLDADGWRTVEHVWASRFQRADQLRSVTPRDLTADLGRLAAEHPLTSEQAEVFAALHADTPNAPVERLLGLARLV